MYKEGEEATTNGITRTIAVTVAAVIIAGFTGWQMSRPSVTSLASNKPLDAKTRQATGQDAAPIMGYLETEGHKITLYGNGRYGIADKHGKMLMDNVGLDEVKKSNPSLAGILNRALAQDARGRHTPDSGLRSILMHNDAGSVEGGLRR